MMKNKFIKLIALVLALCALATMALSGCAAKGETLLSLDGYTFSVNLYQLMLTQQKGRMAYAINSQYGSYNSESYWGMTIDMETQMTNEDYYNNAILERAKNFLCAL